MNCPVCHLPARTLGVRSAIRIHDCGSCGHRFAEARGFDPGTAYDADYAGFARDPVFAAAARGFFAREIVPRVGAGARVLDVGCGNGVVLEAARDAGLRARGIDVSAAAIAACRARGLDAAVGDFTTFDFGPEPFDVVMFWDVLEHLERPGAFVDRALALLRPGGWLFVKVPGHRRLSVALASYVPRLAGALLQVPHHLQLYTRSSIERLLGGRCHEVVWMGPQGMRGRATGGRLERRVARAVVHAIHRASGDGNHTLLARKA